MKNDCMRGGVNIWGEKLSLSFSEQIDVQGCRLLVLADSKILHCPSLDEGQEKKESSSSSSSKISKLLAIALFFVVSLFLLFDRLD